MDLSFKLEVFEGPLDLLLHLIEKNRVDIYDIPIAGITDQYLAYVAELEKQDMDLVSDFLVMAATLLDIKSRMLLPVEKTEEGVQEDPREELVQRLLEYKMYKVLSQELKEKQTDAERYFFKDPTIPPEVADYEEPVDPQSLLAGLTLSRLHEIFRSVMQRQTQRVDPVRSSFGKIKREPFRVSDKIRHILDFTGKNRRFTFRNLLETQAERTEIIVTLLAVLELMRLGQLRAVQETLAGEIELERTETGDISAEELLAALEAQE